MFNVRNLEGSVNLRRRKWLLFRVSLTPSALHVVRTSPTPVAVKAGFFLLPIAKPFKIASRTRMVVTAASDFIELMFLVDIVVNMPVQSHLLTLTRRAIH